MRWLLFRQWQEGRKKHSMIDIQIKNTPLSVDECRNWLVDERVGGEVLFVGKVRNHTQGKVVIRLDFEAYEPMAIKEMKKIAEQAMSTWPLSQVIIHHRVGQLEIGEIAVIIGVAAAHRKEAFAACEFSIDTLKERVPIWKKEIFADGEVWVAAHP